jgi:signal peptidase II
MRRIAALGLVALTVLAIDMLIKARVEQWLAPFQQVALIGDGIRLTRAYNTGVAFGLLREGSVYLLLLTGVLVAGLAVWAVVTVRQAAPGYRAPLALGLLLGGAAANFGDRMLDGRVTDYLDIGWGAWRWPTFNLADGAIVLGVFLLVTLVARPQPPLPAGRSGTL